MKPLKNRFFNAILTIPEHKKEKLPKWGMKGIYHQIYNI